MKNKPNQDKPIGVLFICLGNICRSPAAEGVFRKLVQDRDLEESFHIDSCGTGSWHVGELPHHLTRKVALEHGIELTHRARKFRGAKEFHEFDYLIAMDKMNYEDVLTFLPGKEYLNRLYLFRDFEREPVVNSYGKGESVPDPYYGGLDGFYKVHEIVTRCAEGLLHFILRQNRVTHAE